MRTIFVTKKGGDPEVARRATSLIVMANHYQAVDGSQKEEKLKDLMARLILSWPDYTTWSEELHAAAAAHQWPAWVITCMEEVLAEIVRGELRVG